MAEMEVRGFDEINRKHLPSPHIWTVSVPEKTITTDPLLQRQ